jgi:hypothetical protein
MMLWLVGVNMAVDVISMTVRVRMSHTFAARN